MNKTELAKLIDHTQLAATATQADIKTLCDEAKRYGFASVCVNPKHIPLAARLLAGSAVAVCTVVGFPLGADRSEDKAMQAANAVKAGADEVDMVADIGAVKEHDWEAVLKDIATLVHIVRAIDEQEYKSTIIKVILETCYLTDEEIVGASLAAKAAGADFVKTSTGFATPKDADGKPLPNGATVHAVELMRKTVGADMGVKASGGIRSAQTAREMIVAGATRLGTSSGVQIVEEWE